MRLEERHGLVVPPLGLDALHQGQHASDTGTEGLDVDDHVERAALACASVDRRRVRHQPVHDGLAIAHVIFLEMRTPPHAPQLHERVARVALVLGQHDIGLVLGLDQAEVDHHGIGDEVQGDEVGPGFLEGRVLLAQHRLRRADAWCHASGAMADHLVKARGQLAGQRLPPLGPRALVRGPAELLAQAVRLRPFVGLDDVGQ